ncbi:hypothetical protein FPV67DRAFT_1681378 [Lyophyllum atratum]|nr:hypothetical protein FPV67DRAFT_1681378 [Lyophyllum atratum]
MAYLLPPRSASPLTVEGTSILKNVLLPHAAVPDSCSSCAGDPLRGQTCSYRLPVPARNALAERLQNVPDIPLSVKALFEAFSRVGRDRAAAEVRVATHGYAQALAMTELFLARASDEALCAEVIRVLDDDMNHGSRLPPDCLTTLTQVLYEPYLGFRSRETLFKRGEHLKELLKEMEDEDGVADAIVDNGLAYDGL